MKVARYKVKSGDSLSMLAKKYGTTSKVIRRANGLSNNNIRIGQYLLIPTSTKDDSKYALTAQNRLNKTQSQARGQLKLSHVVQSGESLWSIARDNKVSHQSLAKWNGMGPKDTLRVGQKLVIWKKSDQGRRDSYRVLQRSLWRHHQWHRKQIQGEEQRHRKMELAA